MGEQAEREPTMQEIVVALRETWKGVGRVPSPVAVVRGQPFNNRPQNPPQNGGEGSAPEVGDLRDAEIERLLAENARLNERIVYLLKIIEREQVRNASHASMEATLDGAMQDVRTALEAEIRPVLLVLLRLLEKQRPEQAGPVEIGQTSPPATPTEKPPSRGGRKKPPVAAYVTVPSEWIVELMRKTNKNGSIPADEAVEVPPRPTFRQRMARVLDALRA